jgi:hypothetical protein
VELKPAHYPPKITFGEMLASGVHSVLVYCRDHRCSHSTTISADRWRPSLARAPDCASSSRQRISLIARIFGVKN